MYRLIKKFFLKDKNSNLNNKSLSSAVNLCLILSTCWILFGLSACMTIVPPPSQNLPKEAEKNILMSPSIGSSTSDPSRQDHLYANDQEDSAFGVGSQLGLTFPAPLGKELTPRPGEKLDLDQARTDLDFLIKNSGLSDQVSLMVLLPDRNETVFTLNEDLLVNIASTVKVPMSLYCYDQAMLGMLNLDENLTYQFASDYEGGSGNLQNVIHDGDQLTIGKYLELAIIDSDNIATNMVFRYWREKPENLPLTDRMNSSYGMDYHDGMATAVGMKPVLIRLIQNPDKNPHYQKLLSDMRSTTFNGFITQPLTVGSYAHKYGEYGGYIGDIGLITGRTRLIFIFYAKNSAGAVDLSHQIGNYLANLSQSN